MRKRGCLLFCVAALLPGAVSAQTMFKCLDGTAVTYSNTPCEKLGLQSGGTVADRVTVLPTVKPPAAREKAPSAAGPGTAKSENSADAPKASPVKPVNPMTEKLIR